MTPSGVRNHSAQGYCVCHAVYRKYMQDYKEGSIGGNYPVEVVLSCT